MFRFAKLQIEIEFLDHPVPGDFLGSRLRGGYGFGLLAQLCRRAEPLSCANNPHLCECDYLRLFRPSRASSIAKPSGAPLGNQENLPATFVIDPPDPRSVSYQANERVRFDLTAIGPMCDQLASSIRAFAEFGKAGIILDQMRRGHFRLTSVRDLLSYGKEVYGFGELSAVVSSDVSAAVSQMIDGTDEIVITFRTPTRIENQNAHRKDKETGLALFTDFYDLVYNLANRVAGLWQVYGDNWPGQAEFYRWRERLLKQSREIKTLHSNLEMIRLSGYSNLQEAPKRLDGFVGSMRFAGDFTAFGQLLRIGEIVHVGTETTCGLGQYRLSETKSSE